MRKGVGATILSRATGCAQSLIHFVEKSNGNEPGKFAAKFADVLGVAPEWLIDDDESLAPPGFDPVIARRAREKRDKAAVLAVMSRAPATAPKKIVVSAAGHDSAEALMDSIIESVLRYRRLAGVENTKGLIAALSTLAQLGERGEGQNKVHVTTDQGTKKP